MRSLRTLLLTTLTAGMVAGVAATAVAAPVTDGPVEPYDQYIVKFTSGTNRAAALKAVGAKLGIVLTETRAMALGAHVVRLDKRGHGVLNALMARGDVEYAEPDARMELLAAPTDPRYADQWHYAEATAGLNLAWDANEGSGVTVAVLDTGRTAHSDLDGNTVAGYDFISSSADARDGNGRDNNPQDQGDWNATDGECGATSKAKNSSWHGTHVAGTIAAINNNAVGVAGVATKAKVQHVRVLGKCGGSLSDIADAIIWASGGTVTGIPANPTPAKVINMSLGGAGTCGTTYQNAINSAVGRGSTIVVSAGNSNADTSGYRPASCNNVISVAATDRGGNRAFYSNYGNTVDIAAPGGEVRLETDAPGSVTTPENGVWSTWNVGTTTPGDEGYKSMMGTSMAAPHVSGLAALMIGKKSSLTPAQVESTLKSTARTLAGTCTGGCGAGLASASAALAALDTTPVAWQNAGFESGNTGWTASTGVIDNTTTYAARTGSWKAWLCGVGSTTTESLSQQVTIASTATSATLKFWLRIDSAETTSSTVYDTLKVQVGTTTLATYSNLNETTSYVEKSIDLSAYKGQTVTIKFLGSEDSSLKTSFLVDDTSVTIG